jgi:hypothetical protein
MLSGDTSGSASNKKSGFCAAPQAVSKTWDEVQKPGPDSGNHQQTEGATLLNQRMACAWTAQADWVWGSAQAIA